MKKAVASIEKPKIKLTGNNGNVFNLIGIAQDALKKAGQKKEAENLMNEVFAASNYYAALNIIKKYCDVR